ncbi:MAG: hypothetical protein HY537_17355 [Deltaproteobacteria bacterium]|nr:hypothetical protein [Deltaproteobacteria bacterium]
MAKALLMVLAFVGTLSFATQYEYQCGDFKVTLRVPGGGGYPVIGGPIENMWVEGKDLEVSGVFTKKHSGNVTSWSLNADTPYQLTYDKSTGKTVLNKTPCN